MRWLCIALVLSVAVRAWSQEQGKLSRRHGFDADRNFYSQKTPQESLLSITRAIESERIDYLLAQLADPRFVDEAVADYKGSIRQGDDKAKLFLAFDRLVNETRQYLLEDPTLLKELRRFAKEADWQANETQAVGTLKSIQGRKVFLHKYEDRWFLENKQQ
jgi:hypothetical protein